MSDLADLARRMRAADWSSALADARLWAEATEAVEAMAAAPHPTIAPDADLAARLEQHARIHDEHVPYDEEQARWAADLRAAAEVVRGASAQPQAAGGWRQEIARLRTALRFYARGDHYHLDEREEFDTVSDEPQNWLCSGLDESATMVENGRVALFALQGIDSNWRDGDDDNTPLPVEGEVSCASEPHEQMKTAVNSARMP